MTDEPPAVPAETSLLGDPLKKAALPVPAEPLAESALARIFRAPLSALEVVLVEPARLTKTISNRRDVLLLSVVLAYVTVLFSLPYGAVLDVTRFWRVSVLLVGTLAICLPSLQVFSAYIGFRIDTGQNLALGLILTSVAAMFCFGFFPILWFLKATMLADSTVTPQGISVLLLSFALLAGVGHLFRCFRSFDGLVEGYRVLMLCWLVLFHFIAYRMARILDLI